MLLELTELKSKESKEIIKTKVFVNTEHIIKASPSTFKPAYSRVSVPCTKIKSIGAMVTTTYVSETVEEIKTILKK